MLPLFQMQIDSLAVIHIKKRNSGVEAETLAARLKIELLDCFILESCQRWLWVAPVSQISEFATLRKLHESGIQIYREKEAYDFLLRVATGLESEVVGETDIFGQLKEAWKKFADTESVLVDELLPWFQRLFEDTKEIRSQYLHDLGGASYGSLCRKVLGRPGGTDQAKKQKVLIIGAGQIAQSIAPWLTEYELLLWNRSSEKLKTVGQELESKGCKPGTGYSFVMGFGAEERAWREATHVVICIPVSSVDDQKRIALWKEGREKGYNKGHIIHLGGSREQCQKWARLASANFHALDDLFQLKDEQDAVRSRSIRLARLACGERAKLRVLGGLSVPHGWEDLMGFASDRELALSWTY